MQGASWSYYVGIYRQNLTKSFKMTCNWCAGCIYEYDAEHPIGGRGYTEEDVPNYDGSYYRFIPLFLKSFRKSQFPQKSVNLSFVIVKVKDQLTDLWGVDFYKTEGLHGRGRAQLRWILLQVQGYLAHKKMHPPAGMG